MSASTASQLSSVFLSVTPARCQGVRPPLTASTYQPLPLTEGSRSERAHSVMLPVRFMARPPVGALGKPSESAQQGCVAEVR